MDLGTVGSDLANNPLAQLVMAVLTGFGGYKMWRMQSGTEAVSRANNEGQISALQTWKELLEGERAARVRAEERSDAFAKEREDAMQGFWEMSGQLKTLNETINRQNVELIRLRDQICELEEMINGPHP